MNHVQDHLANRHRVTVGHQVVWWHWQCGGVDGMRDGPRSGSAGERTEGLPVIPVAVGGDDRSQIGAVRPVAQQVHQPLRVVGRVDQQCLAGAPADEQVGVVVHRPDGDLGDGQRAQCPSLRRSTRCNRAVIVRNDVHSR
jgi:hypothetical protein